MKDKDPKLSVKVLLNKVPEITLFFWVIKILCTTVGETGADLLNKNLNFGHDGVTAIIQEIQIQGNSEFARFGSAPTQPVQIITRLDQVEEMMSKGWRLVATLPAEKAVLEKNEFG